MTSSASILVGNALTLGDVDRIAQGGAVVGLDQDVPARLAKTRESLEKALAGGATIYGVNTGFGALAEHRIDASELVELQKNLLRSHAVGVGAPLGHAQVRCLLALRAHTLSLGASGATPGLPAALLDLLNAGILPVVPSQGSVGASGDLAPLAHLALVVIGEGRAYYDGQEMSGAQALQKAGLKPYDLGPKEGLSLINGTQVTTAICALATYQAAELVATADVLGAMSLDASLGTVKPCDPRIHALKPHAGQQMTAKRIIELVQGSALAKSHADCGRVQDAYSLRCMPQVHGTARNAIEYIARAVTTEINSATDNPLLLASSDAQGFETVSGGNFHAANVALVADHGSAACTTLATISERRLERLVNVHLSRGLPAFLANDPGRESGFMMAQVTASALASECKSLSFPACVDTIPTSAGQEDHVSMGPIAARKFAQVTQNVARVFAVEAAIAARALDLREHATSERLQAVHAQIRKYVPPFTGDQAFGSELDALGEAILRGELREAAGLEQELNAL